MKRTGLVVVVAAMVVAAGAQAQGISELPSGVRVRVTIPDSVRQAPFIPRRQIVIGTLARATSDTLWVHVAGPDTLRLPRSSTAVQVSRGVSRGRSAIQSGLAIGVGVLLAAYPRAHSESARRDALAMAGGGVLAGALIGAWSPYETWRRVR
jgi:hypothetical protein